MRATLIYNPVSGRQHTRRGLQVDAICAVLRTAGYLVDVKPTVAAGSASGQVRDALSAGATHIFACGGDGTVHDVLQGIVGERNTLGEQPVLGVVPMGSANVLARHLGLSMQPEAAVEQLMSFVPRTLPIGRMLCGGATRYFLVVAGAGPDGALVYGMPGSAKGRFGRLAYYAHAARLFATRRFRAFDLHYVEEDSRHPRTMRAVSVMAARVDDLGGMFSRLGCSGQLHHAHLRLIAVRPPGVFGLPLWFAMGLVGLGRWNPLVCEADVSEFQCVPLSGHRVHVQADGDWVGEAPMQVSLVHDAVRLLMPA